MVDDTYTREVEFKHSNPTVMEPTLKKKYICKLKSKRFGNIIEEKLKWTNDMGAPHWRTVKGHDKIDTETWDVIEFKEVPTWHVPKVHFLNIDAGENGRPMCNSRSWVPFEFAALLEDLTCSKCIGIVKKITAGLK